MKSDVVIGDNKLELTRFFGYPREAVYAAWTESHKIEKWWGCKNTTHVRSEIDLREGGTFKHFMQIEGAGEMAYEGVYAELNPPEKIVTKSQMDMGPGGTFESTTTVEFFEEAGGTRVKLTQVGLPPMPDAGKIISGGFGDAFEKLDGVLAA